MSEFSQQVLDREPCPGLRDRGDETLEHRRYPGVVDLERLTQHFDPIGGGRPLGGDIDIGRGTTDGFDEAFGIDRLEDVA